MSICDDDIPAGIFDLQRNGNSDHGSKGPGLKLKDTSSGRRPECRISKRSNWGTNMLRVRIVATALVALAATVGLACLDEAGRSEAKTLSSPNLSVESQSITRTSVTLDIGNPNDQDMDGHCKVRLDRPFGPWDSATDGGVISANGSTTLTISGLEGSALYLFRCWLETKRHPFQRTTNTDVTATTGA